MLPEELRQAIRLLREQGQPLRAISRTLNVSRNSVRRALRADEGERPAGSVADPALQAVVALLPGLYRDCKGNAVRIAEVLKDQHGTAIAYSTLTRLIRDLTDLRAPKKRSGTYTFAPGEEMQHDTSPHRLTLGGKVLTAQCASLVLAYSRLLFVQYYPRFTRFEAKAFLTAALQFFDGAARRCVIDNTSVILAGGAGASARIAPEMAAFAAVFGFEFMAHAIGHSDRKGRIERPFAYAENNFLAGRTFADWADLNAQARAWCQGVANAKVKRVLGMSAQAAYLMEKPHLLPLPPALPPVSEIHHRVVDSYGFVHLDTNRYSVPERWVGKPVAVHKHPEQVLVYADRQLIAEHPRLIEQRQGEQRAPGHHPVLERRRAVGPSPQEQALTGRDPRLDAYVAALKQRAPGRGVGKLRRLLELKRTYPAEPFLAAIAQALHYGLFDLSRLERLILERVAGDFFDLDGEDPDA
jgi:transposase